MSTHGVDVTRDLRWLLPDVDKYVICPNVLDENAPRLEEGRAYCSKHGNSVLGIVQHLNDACLWTREEVADWLDTLDLDLTFPAEPPPKAPWRPVLQAEYSYLESDPIVIVSWPKSCGKTLAVSPKALPHYMLDVEAGGGTSLYEQLVNFFAHDVKTTLSADYSTSWLAKFGNAAAEKAAKTIAAEALKADKDVPDALKRPDGTALPELTTDVWLDSGDGEPKLIKDVKIHPDVAAKFGLKLTPKHPAQPSVPPGVTNNYDANKKGKYRGKHRRS